MKRGAILLQRIRGLPLMAQRHVAHFGDYLDRVYRAAIRDRTLIKTLMRIPGARIDPHFDPNMVQTCGERQNLQGEHVLAYALGGDALLPKASCPRCAGITRDIETYYDACDDAL